MDISISFSAAFLFFTGILLCISAIIAHNSAKLNEINSRTYKLEHVLSVLSTNMQISQLENSFDDMMKEQQKISHGGHSRTIFRSSDGKYVAGSLKELLEKMAKDPRSTINQNELDALKKIFDQISSESEPEDEDEDE